MFGKPLTVSDKRYSVMSQGKRLTAGYIRKLKPGAYFFFYLSGGVEVCEPTRKTERLALKDLKKHITSFESTAPYSTTTHVYPKDLKTLQVAN